MPGKTMTHPEHEVLSAFGLGKLPPDTAREVEIHIAECEPCCRTLLDLQSDTFVDLVRSSNVEKRNRADGDAPLGDTSNQKHSDDAGIADVPTELATHPRYHTVELLGRGGMGDVYKAEHRLMNRMVALKVIKQELLAKPDVVERFRREVQAAAQLSHPNIVTAYDAEQAGDAHFLVMEYVDGTDLAALVKQRRPLSVEIACDFICQTASGLQHAHDRGMVHRDIKPHNLMVTSDGQVKILDFGLATLSGSVEPDAGAKQVAGAAGADGTLPGDPESASLEKRFTNIGCTMGTPDFISPEQAEDAHAADARSDIYSLGCTLYFLLAGNPPFTDGSTAEKLEAHCRREAQPIELFRSDVPEQLANVICRMMAKDPAVRFQTPAEVAVAVEPFVARQPLSQPDTTHTLGTVSMRRHIRLVRWASAISAAAMLLVLAAVFFIRLGETTIRFEVDAPDVAVYFAKDTITIDNDGERIHIKPGEKHTLVVERDDETEVVGRSFQLKRGQKVVLHVSDSQDGLIHIRPDEDEFVLSDVPPPARFRRLATLENGTGSTPERPTAKEGNPNINASKEFPDVFHSPSADATPKVFRSVLQLEVVIKRGDEEAQVEYADGTVVSSDGLIATVLDEPGANQDKLGGIQSATILMLDGSSAAAKVVVYDPAHGVAILRVEDLERPYLTLSTKNLVANQRVSWHAVYKNGRRTYLYTRPLHIRKSDHTVGEMTDLCQIIDVGSSALSAERSGSALVSHDGSLVALMGRQRHWDVTPKNSRPRKKLAWAVPAKVIARMLEAIK